jgi:hypothetical protein
MAEWFRQSCFAFQKWTGGGKTMVNALILKAQKNSLYMELNLNELGWSRVYLLDDSSGEKNVFRS